jgi:hypothetical protein
MQRYVTLGVPWAAAGWQDNYENFGVTQSATRCQEKYRTVFSEQYDQSL